MMQSDPIDRASQPSAYHQFLDRGHPDDYRQEEINLLVRAIRAKENRLVLALPGMGASNLLRFLVTRTHGLGGEINFAYLNCDALDDCLDIEGMFDAVADQLQEQGLGRPFPPSERGYQRFSRLITRSGGDPLLRWVVVADQVDKLLGSADNTLYRKLKALTDLNKRLCYIFAASPRVAETIDPGNVLFAGRIMAVGPLNERDCADAIGEEARRLEVDFDPGLQQQLARLSGGHPGLLRAISSALAEKRQPLTLIAEDNLIEHLLALGSINYRCQKMWQELNLAQQTTLQFLANGRFEAASAESIVWLQRFGLVVERPGETRIFTPLFERFVTLQAPPLELITIQGASTILKNGQHIVVAGKVLKGNREVRVAPLELKLIACLKRERRVYTKDEIAAYVFPDEHEPGDPPDPRIENLVRQVRERLGKRYIKTVFGQGYEFLG